MKLFNMFLVSVLILSSCVLFNSNVEAQGANVARGVSGLITESDLVGTWVCKAIAPASASYMRDIVWEPKGEGAEGGCLYYQYLGGEITFVDNKDGSFSITLPNQDPCFLVTTNQTGVSPYVIKGNVLYRVCYYFGWGMALEENVAFYIKKINANRIILKSLDNSLFASQAIVCDRVLNPSR